MQATTDTNMLKAPKIEFRKFNIELFTKNTAKLDGVFNVDNNIFDNDFSLDDDSSDNEEIFIETNINSTNNNYTSTLNFVNNLSGSGRSLENNNQFLLSSFRNSLNLNSSSISDSYSEIISFSNVLDTNEKPTINSFWRNKVSDSQSLKYNSNNDNVNQNRALSVLEVLRNISQSKSTNNSKARLR